MAPTRAYPAETREAAARLRAEGRTYAEISAELGVKRATLASWWTRRAGSPLPKPRRKSWQPTHRPDAVVEQARRLRSDGLTQQAIGQRLGVPQSTVARWCNGKVEGRVREFSTSGADRRCEGEG